MYLLEIYVLSIISSYLSYTAVKNVKTTSVRNKASTTSSKTNTAVELSSTKETLNGMYIAV